MNGASVRLEANQRAGLVSSAWGTCHAVQLGTFMLWISPCKLCGRRLRVSGVHGLKSVLSRKTCPLVFGDGDKVCMLWSKDLSVEFPWQFWKEKENQSHYTKYLYVNLYIQGCLQECIFETAMVFSTGRHALEVYWYFAIGNKDQICWQEV